MNLTKDWLRYGECLEIAAAKGVSRKTFLKLLDAKNGDEHLIVRRVFEGCSRRHYGRASLLKVLQTETKP